MLFRILDANVLGDDMSLNDLAAKTLNTPQNTNVYLGNLNPQTHPVVNNGGFYRTQNVGQIRQRLQNQIGTIIPDQTTLLQFKNQTDPILNRQYPLNFYKNFLELPNQGFQIVDGFIR